MALISVAVFATSKFCVAIRTLRDWTAVFLILIEVLNGTTSTFQVLAVMIVSLPVGHLNLGLLVSFLAAVAVRNCSAARFATLRC